MLSCGWKDNFGGDMESAFSSWIGRSVVLRVALGDSRVGVRGRLIKDGAETLKMRLIEGLDIDIYKEMVLAVEEDPPLFLMS
jgi:RNase P/RNase MRP subunit p29